MPKKLKIELKRHYQELPEKKADEIVQIAADLLVNYVKERGLVPAWRTKTWEREQERRLQRERNR